MNERHGIFSLVPIVLIGPFCSAARGQERQPRLVETPASVTTSSRQATTTGVPGFDVEQLNICSGVDNRTESTDKRVGRICVRDENQCNVCYCTAFVISNGALLTAGHCVDLSDNGTVHTRFANSWVEFNVSHTTTPSACNGQVGPVPATDVYFVDSVARFNSDGTRAGSDYAVFSVFPNTFTSMTPALAQGKFVRVTQEVPTGNDDVRVTGAGRDTHPNGCGGSWSCVPSTSSDQCSNCNAFAFTLQTEAGGYRGESTNGSRVRHKYRVDTQSSSSGSPVIWEGHSDFAIGIHERAACAIVGIGSNQGTSFNYQNLADAVNDFLGSGTVYADTKSLASRPNGTIFAPYLDVQEAADNVPNGGQIAIVTGTYGGPVTFGDDGKAMTVVAPVGQVTIGE